jgi:hypothetical protein
MKNNNEHEGKHTRVLLRHTNASKNAEAASANLLRFPQLPPPTLGIPWHAPDGLRPPHRALPDKLQRIVQRTSTQNLITGAEL